MACSFIFMVARRTCDHIGKWQTRLFSCDMAECARGVAEVEEVTCNSTGGNVSVPENYTCNTGYFVAPEPTYCQRMLP
jgi:hypothetical protein